MYSFQIWLFGRIMYWLSCWLEKNDPNEDYSLKFRADGIGWLEIGLLGSDNLESITIIYLNFDDTDGFEFIDIDGFFSDKEATVEIIRRLKYFLVKKPTSHSLDD